MSTTPERMTAPDIAAVARGLAVYDTAAKDCPARKRHLGPTPCPRCGNGPSDGCGLEIGAAYAFVEAMRAHLLTQEQ